MRKIFFTDFSKIIIKWFIKR